MELIGNISVHTKIKQIRLLTFTYVVFDLGYILIKEEQG
jgi:hypothetical protein